MDTTYYAVPTGTALDRNGERLDMAYTVGDPETVTADAARNPWDVASDLAHAWLGQWIDAIDDVPTAEVVASEPEMVVTLWASEARHDQGEPPLAWAGADCEPGMTEAEHVAAASAQRWTSGSYADHVAAAYRTLGL